MTALLKKRDRGEGASELVSELQSVTVSFGEKVVLKNFSLQIPKGRRISVLGESSSGKSTLLKVLTGLVPPEAGKVLLFNRDVSALKLTDLERSRRRLGMQFQAGALFDSMNVAENLFLASLESSRRRGGREAASKEEIAAMLKNVGLEKAAALSPSSLSGGMKKRAAIARALIVNPELAIFDEPTAGLDPLTSGSIIRLLNRLSENLGAAMILATSDVDVARRFSADIVILHEGGIRARGSLEEHLTNPDPYIVKFLARYRKLGSAD
ncbi:MAG: ATP-binding cassette domain-containing protein [Deltaproteobacteria bacterium]|jgi:phospholipid/cholesterol/gamma-HCH transport system ATP-binding protein|nr:ATP-binding cassette domain-containing protein [Deltaproteobacteria bacterium]